MTSDVIPELTAFLTSRFPEGIVSTHEFRGDETVVVKREVAFDVLQFLRDERQFDILMDLTAVDLSKLNGWNPPAPRFEVVYHLLALAPHQRFRLKVPVVGDGERYEVASATALWRAADWFEREVWDMFGIRFTGHQNLKRILMYEEFEGFPLRKDYPVNKRQPLIGPMN